MANKSKKEAFPADYSGPGFEAMQLAKQIHELGVRLYGEKAMLRKQAPGQYAAYTVYKVKKTRVKAHTRRAYVAVRMRRAQ